MADQVVKITEVTNTISASLNDGSYNLLAGGTIGGSLQINAPLTVGVNDLGHDVKFFGATSGKYLQWDESADKLVIAGDLDVTGTTTSFNSTVVTIDDPVFTIGGDTAPSSDDNKDRGIEFRYHDGSTPRVGFFGYDDSESAFTFLTSATNSSEVFSGTLGNLKVNTVYHGDGTASSPSVRFNLDTDTGIFRPTANTLAFTTGGSEAARFDSSGNLKLLNNLTISSAYPRIFLTDTNNNSDYSIINNDGTFSIYDDTNASHLMFLNSTGLGIGGTASAKLDVQLEAGAWNVGSSFTNKAVRISGGSGGLGLAYDDTTGATIAAIHHGNSYKPINLDGSLHKLSINATEKMRLDSTGLITVAGTGGGATTIGSHIDLGDNQKVRLGAGDDLTLFHNGTNSNIENITGNINIINYADDKDIAFQCDDGSGGVETYFLCDGSASSGNPIIRFPDNSIITLGTANDFYAFHNGSNTFLQNNTGDLYITNAADDKDIIFQADDGSGGDAVYFRLDGGFAAPVTVFPDNSSLSFGTGTDFSLYHDGSNSYINQTGTGNLIIRTNTDDGDIIFQSDNGSGSVTKYFQLDGGLADGTNTYTTFPDNSRIRFGDGLDLDIHHDGSNSYISQTGTGNLNIQQTVDDADIIFKCDNGSGGTTQYFRLAGDEGINIFSKNVKLIDSVQLNLGGGNDLQLYHDGSNSYVTNATGDLYFINSADNKDITFMSDDGSGGFTTYFFLDGSSAGGGNTYTKWGDNDFISMGDGSDLYIYHNGTDSYLANGTGNFYITNGSDDNDIIFQCDDGSGGKTEYFRLDGGDNKTIFSANVQAQDNVRIYAGSSGDLAIFHDGSSSIISNNTGHLDFQNNSNDADIRFICDDGSGGTETYFYLDGSASSGNPITVFPDNSILQIGGDFDLRISHDGTDSTINNYTGALIIKNSSDDNDIIFQSDDGSGGTETYFYLDGSASSGNPFTVFPDLSELAFGDSRDLRIKHTSSDSYISNYTGNLYIRNDATDKDIVFQTDDGSGGLAQYIAIDGSAGLTQFDKDTKYSDTIKATFGNSGDFQIYHTGTNTTMLDQGTGALVIASNNLRVLSANQAETLIEATEDGAIDLYHNNSKKFETTSAGVTITGDLTVSGSTNQTFNDVTVNGNLTVSGTTTTIDTANLTVEDKNIIIGNVSSPSDTTADGGGITLKGASDYTIAWNNTSNRWHFNQGIQLDDSKKVAVGSASDASFYHNGTLTYLENATGNLTIRNLSDGDDIIIQTDNGSGGVENYLQFDGGGRLMRGYRNFRVQDDVKLQAGSGGDLEIKHTSNHSYIDNQTGDLTITNHTDDGDLIFRSDNGSGSVTEYFRLDGGLAHSVASKHIRFEDNVIARFGSGNDASLYHTGTDTIFENTNGDLYIKNHADDKDIIFQCDDGSGGVETYFYLDGSYGAGTYVWTSFPDNSIAAFGDGKDLRLYHNGTDSFINNNSGDLNIVNLAADKDILFKADDGSGGLAEYFRLDGGDETIIFSKTLDVTGSQNIKLTDNGRIRLGNSNDIDIYHGGTNSFLINSTGDLTIRNAADDKDIIFQCDDGSGGTETYFYLDGSSSSGDPNTVFPDNSKLTFGDSFDLKLFHNGTDSHIQNLTGDLRITNYADDKDIIFSSDDGSGGTEIYFYLDGSAGSSNPFTVFPDNARLTFGTGYDLRLVHNGTDSYIQNFEGDLKIVNFADDKDIIFQSDDGSGGTEIYFYLDGSASSGDPNTVFPDNSKLTFGNDYDLRIQHAAGNSSGYIQNYTGDLYIENSADDKDIVFRCDDGSGGVTEYFRLDGGDTYVVFSRHTRNLDTMISSFGDSDDLRISHNGTSSEINNYTGNLFIRNFANDSDIIFDCDDGSGGTETYFYLDGSMNTDTTAKTVFPDNSKLQFGSGASDLRIYHDGTDSQIESKTGTLFISNNVNNADVRLQASTDSNSTAVDYIILDSSQNAIRMKRQTKWDNNILATFGDSDDLQIYHDGTDSYVSNTQNEGNLVIENGANGKDILFKCDDGSGGLHEYMRLDGGMFHTIFSKSTQHADGAYAKFGNAADMQIVHDGSNNIIKATVHDLIIENSADDKDIIFKADDGSGGTETYFYLDGSASSGNPITIFPDMSFLSFGSDNDLQIVHTGSQALFTNYTGDLTFTQQAADKDIIFQSDDGSGGVETYFFCDGSKSTGDPYTIFPNNSFLGFGDDGNFLIRHTGLGASIQNNGGDISITQNTNDGDIRFYCDDNSGGVVEYFRVDGGASQIHFSKELRLIDGVQLQLGTDNDMQVTHNGATGTIQNATGDLAIKTLTADSDLEFYADDGSGSTTKYFGLDGGLVLTKFLKHTRHNDGINAYFGDDNDFLVGNNGTISTLQAQTGDIQLKALGSASDITFYAASTLLLSLDGGREVVHHHRGVEYNTVLVDNANHTVGTADHIILMHSLNTGRTVTIPTSQCDLGRVLIIKDRDGTGGLTPITIATEGSQTIDGAATKVVNSTAYGSVTIVCDGTNWSVI